MIAIYIFSKKLFHLWQVIWITHASEIVDVYGFPLIMAEQHHQITSVNNLAFLITDAYCTITDEAGVQWHLPKLGS